MGSEYLRQPPRTLRDACREARVAHSKLITGDCDMCPHGELCAISEQIELGRRRYGTRMETEPSRKVT